MRVVVDTNILFSALLREGNHFADILQLSENIEFFIPKYAIVELLSTKKRLLNTAKFRKKKSLKLITYCLNQFMFLTKS